MRPRETLTHRQEQRQLEVRLACPDITRACDLTGALADLVRHQRGHLLMEWIRQAETDAPTSQVRAGNTTCGICQWASIQRPAGRPTTRLEG